MVESARSEANKAVSEVSAWLRGDHVLLTTETAPVGLVIKRRISVITAECVFGMNLFRDFLSAVVDTTGGRSQSTQNVLRDLRLQVLRELKLEAAAVGANAVIAVSLSYNEISGKDKSMLFAVACGTAVEIESDLQPPDGMLVTL